MATSRSLNKVILIGNLTRDPSMKQLPNGAYITTFGLATNKNWKTQDGKIQEKAEYHNIVCWNKLAEICANLLQIGMLVYVEGEIISQIWEQNGVKMIRYEIRASDMKIMDHKGKKGVGIEQSIKNGKLNKDDQHLTNGEPSMSNPLNGKVIEKHETMPMISDLANIDVPVDESPNQSSSEPLF